jgi:hypothetical protein
MGAGNLDDLLRDAGITEEDLKDDLTIDIAEDSTGKDVPDGGGAGDDKGKEGDGGEAGKDAKGDGEGAGTGEDKGDDGDTGGKDEKADDLSELESLRAQNAALADQLREMRRDLRSLRKGAQAPAKDGEEGDDLDEEEAAAAKEQAATVQHIQELRYSELETFQEMMRLNPQFTDYDSVVNKQNVEEFMDAVAGALAKKDSLRFDEALERVEEFIWSKKNPWRYLYDQLKPKGGEKDGDKGKGEGKEGEKKDDGDTEAAKKLLSDRKKKTAEEANKAPSTVADQTGAVVSDKFTSASLDEMSEDELNEVPQKVLDAWMAGKLK